jgi:TPR repeat protein
MIPAMIPAMIPHLILSDRRQCLIRSGARKDKRGEENDWRRAKYNKTAEYYIKKAQAGDHDAQFCLGRGYEHGEDDDLDLEMDKAKALEYYRKAAKGGHADAVDRLVDAYDAGELCLRRGAPLWSIYRRLQILLEKAELGYSSALWTLAKAF